MPKYQFFKLEQDAPHEVRFLATHTPDFLAQKELLLAQGFIVVGDMIYARDEAEAVTHYQSGMSYPVGEYGKSTVTGGVYYALEAVWDGLKSRLKRSA